MDEYAAQPLMVELQHFRAEFPDLAPRSAPAEIAQRSEMSGVFYPLAALQTYIAGLVARLHVELESTDTTPITEPRQFAFIRDEALRTILERDHKEIQKAFVGDCWKSVIILSGGALEAILLDLVLQHESAAKSSAKAPREPDVRRWDLASLVEVSVEQKLVGPYTAGVSDATRQYRNLVHPGNEMRTNLRFGKEEARIALSVLEMIHRDLSR